MNSNWTGRIARTQDEAFGCNGQFLEIHRPPLYRRFFYALCDYGAAVFIGCVLAAGLVYGWSLP